MTIGLDLSSRILEAKKEAVKVENLEAEDISGMLKKLEAHADGTLCLDNRSWYHVTMKADIAIICQQIPDLCPGYSWTSEDLWVIGPTIYRMEDRWSACEDHSDIRGLLELVVIDLGMVGIAFTYRLKLEKHNLPGPED
ncbi:hypothetical protein Tco_1055962 [Tanacetum coccineum]|uniref:Uncharacterized protein n=1 Tax=Tanacetum coccineum TaxID=301880 RepID=A0ABQ5H159_9ASTR